MKGLARMPGCPGLGDEGSKIMEGLPFGVGLKQEGLAAEMGIELAQAGCKRRVVKRVGPAFEVAEEKEGVIDGIAAGGDVGALHGLTGAPEIRGKGVVDDQEEADVGGSLAGDGSVVGLAALHN